MLAVMWAAISLAVSWPLVPQELPIPSWFIPKLKGTKKNLYHTRLVAKEVYVLQEAKLRGWGAGIEPTPTNPPLPSHFQEFQFSFSQKGVISQGEMSF